MELTQQRGLLADTEDVEDVEAVAEGGSTLSSIQEKARKAFSNKNNKNNSGEEDRGDVAANVEKSKSKSKKNSNGKKEALANAVADLAKSDEEKELDSIGTQFESEEMEAGTCGNYVGAMLFLILRGLLLCSIVAIFHIEWCIRKN